MSVTVSSPAVRSLHVSRSHHKRISKPRVVMSAVRSSDSLGVAPILTKLKKDCATPLPVLRHVADAMAVDMRAGLAVDGGSDLKMILSYVDTLPTGYTTKSSCLLTFLFVFSYVYLSHFASPDLDVGKL